MVATTTISKRRPYPYDAKIGNVNVILEPQADGNFVSQKTKTLDATAPTDYTYSSANPYKERASEWNELFGGFGQAAASTTSTHPRRYSYAEKADLSIDGLWMKGPKFETHIQEIDASAGEVRQFITALHGGTETLFAICENGVYRRVDDSASGGWTVSLSAGTLGGGVLPQQAVRFKHRGVGTPVDSLYLATSASNLWRYDGSTWTLATSAEGPGTGVVQGEARFVERVNDEFWVAGDYWVVKCTDNPMLRANYSAVIYIGDQTNKITWLKQMNDELRIFKEDGVYTVDTDGLDHELFPTLRGKNSPLNGKNAAVWINRMWFTYGDQTFILDESAVLKPDGTEQMLENTSDVQGRWVAGAGHNTWFFYELLYNSIINTTFLIKHGTWVEESEAANRDAPGIAQFAEAHHGALYDWNNEAVSLEIVPDIHSGGNDRLYVGFVDGTTQWCVLPRTGPNPTNDPNCEFTSEDSWVYLPIHHSNFRADNKLYHAVSVAGPYLTQTEWVEVQYKLDVANPLAEWTTLAPEQPKFTVPGQRFDFTQDEVGDPIYGKQILLRVLLAKDPSLSASPANLSPVTEGIIIHESIRPSFSREFVLAVKAGSYLPRRDSMVDRRRGSQIQEALLEEAAKVGPVNLILPSGETEVVTIVEYRDSAASFGKRRDHEYLIQMQCMQLGFLSGEETNEPTSGLTYATLEQYTLGELEAII